MLACERHGSGEPLVLVHGLTHRRQAWYPVLDRLVADREVILVDLPGHGDSPDLVTDGRPVEIVLREQFGAFLAEQGLDRPHVAGNSLGGRVALEAGANGHARSVTALSPAGFWRTDVHFAHTRRIFCTAASVVDRLGRRAELIPRTWSGRRFEYGLLMVHPARVPADHALGDLRNFRRAMGTLRPLLDAATPFDSVIDPAVPVTIAWAARDLVLPSWQADVAREVFPDAVHLTMRGVGHIPMWDDPAQVAEVLLAGSAPVARIAAAPRTVAPRPRRGATA